MPVDIKILKALAEANRLRIVELLLERPHSVLEVAERLGLQQPQVSKHLKVLVEAGLVGTFAVAQQRYHGLRPERLRELGDWVGGFSVLWDTQSSRRALYERSLREGRPIPTPGNPFRIEHITPAPVAEVWRAWTDAELFAAWFAPDHFTVPACELDPRPGGAIRLVLAAPDGTAYPMEGEYDAVEEPHRISYAARPLAEDGTPLFELMVTGTFDPRHAGEDERSHITVDAAVLSTGPEAAPYLAGLEPGWQQNLAKLDRLLAGR
jgi:uncharacterized protein YndB with AHSA1/START domain/DNA-binding transcriptional ArsR family regulator